MMQPLPWHRIEFDALVAARRTLPHALLVQGQRGIGKLEFARALAQAMLCETPTQENGACGACAACAWFEAGAHPDYRQIEPSATADDDEEEEGEKPTKKGKKSI